MANVFENEVRKAINWGAVWTEDDALPVVAGMFDHIVDVLKRSPQFQHISRDQIDLMLADSRRRAEQDIGDIVDGTIPVEDVIQDIVEGLAP